ncbi:MAG: efflux transporter outer membrane subunit [Thermoguttaceae bacterium]
MRAQLTLGKLTASKGTSYGSWGGAAARGSVANDGGPKFRNGKVNMSFTRNKGPRRVRLGLLSARLALLLGVTGCTGLRQWWCQGWKVGPEYRGATASVADNWRDSEDVRLQRQEQAWDWWRVFDDPKLEQLVLTAFRQNLSLQVASLRVMEARRQRQIVAANLWPQSQTAFGNYTRQQFSRNAVFPPRSMAQSFDNWATGFDLSWELDLWGRIRRAIEAEDAELDAVIDSYDDVLVTLIGDVAATYVEICAFDERLDLARQNIAIQRASLEVAKARLDAGRTSQLDVDQARANLASTEALIPLLQQGRRQAENRLAVLLGIPPADIEPLLAGKRPIPSAPREVAVGIPADLLRRRPDVRRAERAAAAQCAQIGIAMADFYPQFGLNGEIRLSAEEFGDLFSGDSLAAFITPGFRWKILNYGRLKNNVRIQEARFQQRLVEYENTVLGAQREAEDALTQFLRSQERAAKLRESVDAMQRAVETADLQFREGKIDYDRVFILETSLVRLQDDFVRAKAEQAIGLIRAYKALGGGWQLRRNRAPGGGAMPTTQRSSAPGEQAIEG